jgi:DNA repair exonuclease SbcCD ATPase subunit
MSEQATLLNRIGKWFRRDQAAGEANGDAPVVTGEPHANSSTSLETRTTFLRPWAKRDAAIQHLQEGFTTLTDLMGAIRNNLEQQNRRQDELFTALQQLPQVLQTIPESSRIQGETLSAIRQQIEGQSAQQERLGEILNRIGQTAGEQKEMVDDIRGRVEDLHQADTSIADYLNNVGASLKDVSRSNQTSTQVLEQMRDNLCSRDGQLERVLHRQGVRFTTMLSVAIVLSIAALVAVGVIGYILINQRGIH